MPVNDLARGDVVTATADASIHDLAFRMDDDDVGSIVITDGDEPVGIVTDRDLTRRVLGEGVDPSGVTASDVMSADLLTVDADAGFYEVATLMSDRGVRRLPVVEDGDLAGIITFDDITELLADEQEQVADIVRAQRPPY